MTDTTTTTTTKEHHAMTDETFPNLPGSPPPAPRRGLWGPMVPAFEGAPPELDDGPELDLSACRWCGLLVHHDPHTLDTMSRSRRAGIIRATGRVVEHAACLAAVEAARADDIAQRAADLDRFRAARAAGATADELAAMFDELDELDR
ncbi:MAG: hypothetical protein ABIV94_00100 [Acidimicrobiales bacterium]